MADGSLVERLRAIPIFAGLDEPALGRLAGACAEIDAPAGHVLIQPREPGAGLYVVEEGTVAIEYGGASVERGPGEFFGELSLLVPDARRSARVRAATPVRCVAIGRADFLELLEAEPAVAVAMLRALARRFLDELER